MYKNAETTISFFVKTIPKLYNEYYLEYVKEYAKTKEINKTQLRALTFVYNYGDVSMTLLCNMLNIEKGSLTTTIDNLEKDGYVTRIKDINDRRKYIIKLTDKGGNIAKDFMYNLKENLKSKIDGISEERKSNLILAMENIIKEVEKI
ncbi:MarR family winged helix-turn-helix transcriptional regulator [Peptostreptococcus equinus]|uniref:MarR family transcriptional regulator n=1 Tax=Peptostreptococcus equinus TaxID=3003601 RepID=A0ABY7JQM9_9FIRM|nr:MarR family transcriptional regulator [Peptostreptococcus sp. CBA3647]WAW15657.1 MarR family transcriptional regulator [Peptostreptococcus sp. CBA3647]